MPRVRGPPCPKELPLAAGSGPVTMAKVFPRPWLSLALGASSQLVLEETLRCVKAARSLLQPSAASRARAGARGIHSPRREQQLLSPSSSSSSPGTRAPPQPLGKITGKLQANSLTNIRERSMLAAPGPALPRIISAAEEAVQTPRAQLRGHRGSASLSSKAKPRETEHFSLQKRGAKDQRGKT